MGSNDIFVKCKVIGEIEQRKFTQEDRSKLQRSGWKCSAIMKSEKEKLR